MSLLYQRARNSGSCPPSILLEECSVFDKSDDFDGAMNKVLDDVGFFLRPGLEVAKNFKAVLEKVEVADNIVGTTDPNLKKKIIQYRRCIVLAVVGGTHIESTSLASIVLDGYLNIVKSWLDDILSSPLGSVDMLLHLLSTVTNLPVTKATIKDSRMGTTIGAIGKHLICKDTPNEPTIKERVTKVKDSWLLSVKARKTIDTSEIAAKKGAYEMVKKTALEASSPHSVTLKRESSGTSSSISPAKRPKTDVELKKKTSVFNALLNRVKGSPNGLGASGINPTISNASEKVVADLPTIPVSLTVKEGTAGNAASIHGSKKQDPKLKKTVLRVKWADHFGGQISVSYEVESEVVQKSNVLEAPVSWSDRNRRDRLREKELLAKAKSSKLLDDDEDLTPPHDMNVSKQWVLPSLLSERTNVVQPILTSQEYDIQENRVSSIVRAHYASDFDVPLSPDPLNDVEQALDMTSQASAIISSIPFFVPQVVLPVMAADSYVEAAVEEQTVTATSAHPAQTDKASFEFVQSLGLPFYLVGQPIEVIQTLAGNPGLLSTLVDANGIYDQQKLMNLVQTLSSKGTPSNPAASTYESNPASVYGAPYNNGSHYGNPSPLPPQTSRTITRKSDDGNLHVSGYGPGVSERDLIAAFSPYVHVDEVVLKGTFAFVNTSDSTNAQRAREALTGTLLNGMPIRINNATRKVRDSNNAYSAPPPPAMPPFVPPRQSTFGSQTPAAARSTPVGLPPPAFGAIHPNVDSVRDDRGNPPTKNLFVAGYGQNTNEQMLRDLFGQYAVVTGVVSKGTFAFVNTNDRHEAVVARENLSGTMFNGGVLRINFAKETGRLGTSFDVTYGPTLGPNVVGPDTRQQNMGFYGIN